MMDNENVKRKPLAVLWLAVGLLFMVLAVVLYLKLNQPPDPTGQADPNVVLGATPTLGPPYDFEIVDLAGQPVRLSDLRGQVVLVNFWATWCGPCREEMPILQAFYDRHRDNGFTLVGVNVSEDAKVAGDWIEEGGYTFPIWSDPPGDMLIELRFSGLPASMLVDEEGRVVKRWLGPFDKESLDDLVLPLLEAG